MSLFEYLAIAYSLVFSMAAMRLVGGLPAALVPDRRYIVHIVMVLTGLLGITLGFWALWSFREIEWTYPRFLLTLLPPAALYFIAAALVPENPEAVASWREHYFAVRRRVFGSFMFWAFAAFLLTTINLGMPLLHPARVSQVAILLFGLTGFLSASEKVHRALAVVIVLIFVVVGLMIGVQPDYLSR